MAAIKAVFLAATLLADSPAVHAPPPRELGANQLVIATTTQLAPVLRSTALVLQRQRPGLKISILGVGSDVAMADLYARRADLAIIGRTATDSEIKAFQWIFQYPPQAWPMLQGSAVARGHSPAIRILVNAANPIQSMTMRQLEMAYRSERPLRWRDLGVSGALAGRAVHPFMPDSEQGTGRFIRQALFGGATLFAWNRVQEIDEPLHRDSSDDRMGSRIAALVAADPQALALVPGDAVRHTRTIRLECGRAVPLCDTRGMLERTVFAYCDPTLRSDAREFLRMLIGGGGQPRVNPAPYRPLPSAEKEEVLSKLE